MSLTSYRAAPPRAKCVRLIRAGWRRWARSGAVVVCVSRDVFAMCGSGGDRLSRALRHSTMGAGVFNGRVRDGIGFWARRSSHQTGASQCFWDWPRRVLRRRGPRSASMQRLALRVFLRPCSRTRITGAIKSIGRLVPVGSTRHRACTPGLSTWSSSTALKGGLVLRGVSRLDAFSGYPVRT